MLCSGEGWLLMKIQDSALENFLLWRSLALDTGHFDPEKVVSRGWFKV